MFECRYCIETTALSEAGARYLGWRIFTGRSLDGSSYADVACPLCTGRRPLMAPVTQLDGQMSLDLESIQEKERTE